MVNRSSDAREGAGRSSSGRAGLVGVGWGVRDEGPPQSWAGTYLCAEIARSCLEIASNARGRNSLGLATVQL